MGNELGKTSLEADNSVPRGGADAMGTWALCPTENSKSNNGWVCDLHDRPWAMTVPQTVPDYMGGN